MRRIFPISLLALFLAMPVAKWSAVQSQAGGEATKLESPSQAPAAYKNVQGELARVDDAKQLLWIKRSDGKEMQFQYTSQTQVTGGDNSIQGLADMNGSQLVIQYQMVGDTNQAVKIAISPNQAKPSAG
jgi:hypothetical protein